MLSENTIRVIKSTVPVLEVHGEAITRHFYETMFAAHPELLNIFNHANQKQGRQQAALANMVYTAALHIDNLSSILPAVRQVAHKHRSLGIVPEQYAIVGTYLLRAIKDVLGDAATDEIITAWGEAYNVIADAFIGIEQDMYTEAVNQTGGWEGFRTFKVAKKVQESEIITSFYLVPDDGQPIATYEPGQYISIKIQPEAQSFTQIRQYSLSDTPGKPYYRISVKRELGGLERPDGVISTYLHDHIEEGSQVELSAPAGDFTLDAEDKRPVVLLSGGVGLTPMISMLNTLVHLNENRAITFLHASPNGQSHAFRDHVNSLAELNESVKAYYCYTQPENSDHMSSHFHKEGYMDAVWLRQVIEELDATYYLCGPVSFMRAVYTELLALGVAADNIHYEFFGPKASLSPAPESV
ncbi:nitric oxide dioxygenase [Paenibacillus sp. CF095]|uniref:NO-inducible flavohemoprotein n=1 Tax=Paenibacillus TaxID=44249 RepID=UPI0008869397|nr:MULTISPECIES: NO-inducible flavohemoprotein [Paenibacillus]TDL68250.1 NO-inducible flavohemoprotein [Paenibacillus amylolyticus]SDC81410.1 nitric oxide dioxygenase [Paenibacillus sp. CF095]